MLHHSCSTNRHPAAPDTTKTTCYRSAAQCWKAFLVQSYYKTGICFWSETLRTLYSATLLILNPTRKPVGFMQSCCPMQTTCMLLDDVWTTSRLGPRQILAWVAQFYAILHPASCACHPHVVHTCHPHMSSAHIICTCHLHMHIIHMHTCHLHIICSTPDGQHCRGITRIHRLPSRPSHPYGRQPHSLIFMSTLYKATSCLPASS